MEELLDCGFFPVMFNFLNQSQDEALRESVIASFFNLYHIWREESLSILCVGADVQIIRLDALTKRLLHAFIVENNGISAFVRVLCGSFQKMGRVLQDDFLKVVQSSKDLQQLLRTNENDPDHDFKSLIKNEIIAQLLTVVDDSDEKIQVLEGSMRLSVDSSFPQSKPFELFCTIFMSLPEEIFLENKQHMKECIDWLTCMFFSEGLCFLFFCQ